MYILISFTSLAERTRIKPETNRKMFLLYLKRGNELSPQELENNKVFTKPFLFPSFTVILLLAVTEDINHLSVKPHLCYLWKSLFVHSGKQHSEEPSCLKYVQFLYP